RSVFLCVKTNIMETKRTDIRNIAIIAHVDHGKTTLVDGLLQQSHVFHEKKIVQDRVMDSNELEQERGITILSKNTAIEITDPESGQLIKINIVDTPGHSDFGGEVERVLNMVDGVLLLVDAAEGPRPQTRFVLQKALELDHKVIVVINKVDRKLANTAQVLNDTFDLFIELGASEEQANFPVVYAIATQHRAGHTADVGQDLQPLFETILKAIPAPTVKLDHPLQLLVTSLEYDNFRGATGIGRIFSGEISAGDQVVYLTSNDKIVPGEITYLYDYQGLERREINQAQAGDIVAISGLEGISIGDTICHPEHPISLPRIQVEAPTVRMSFGVNTSPFFGREGTWKTSRKLRERLFREPKSNLALRVEDTGSPDTLLVSGRGELHLAILIETMRREGYEFHVSRPEVILKTSPSGEIQEPFEQVRIEIQPDDIGVVMESLNNRQGKLLDMRESTTGTVLLTFLAPTRGILGFRTQFLTMTKGTGVLNTSFDSYAPQAGSVEVRSHGSLVAWETGTTTTFGLKNAEGRGILFIEPGVEVYRGMVVGENQRPDDIEINVCKTKHLTNMRNNIREIDHRLVTPREMSLDQCIEYLADDELLEVTPKNLRIRKRVLDHGTRMRDAKREAEKIIG
ncbi:MAG: translational GTPase TypA, partial [Anaerolineales bacterium]|nr:translational GTPase TypA [Anaerolineales bacterium]